ncbi:lim domain containing protein [Sporothrix brasiliensis 5110]|uniref:Lim domain containing protein n=1 Tax=Sporothrix brasiliensis 5110 TaxID=1398154 RepID=A0A0C2FJU8_9PEZI|nr:lim domain containing protein [Sporothrix brasiliensis 5110]KIH91308.1 lim domain containing protein [Sporothrix brasiliensis 5110]
MSTVSARGKPKDRTPSGNYMSNDQFANYLADLRNNRIARPGGTRPLPATSGSSSRRDSGRVSVGSRVSFGMPMVATADAFSSSSSHSRSQSDATATTAAPPVSGRPSLGGHSNSGSVSSRYSTVTGRGRDYYPAATSAASSAAPSVRPLRPDEVVPTDTYMERGQRWMEKEEVVSLRHALEDMDLKQQDTAASGAVSMIPTPGSDAVPDEQRIYAAALDEAAELVWKHQNGIRPPEPGAPYQYKNHLRKNSYAHARTASVGRYGNDIEPSGLARDPASRSVSGSSAGSSVDASGSRRSRHSYGSNRVVSNGSGASGNSGSNSVRQSLDQARDTTSSNPSVPAASGSLRSKTYNGLAGGPRPMVSASFSSTGAANNKAAATGRRRSSMKRNISGEIEKPFSGDQIYEEPETSTPDKRAKATTTTDTGSSSVLQVKPDSVVNNSTVGGAHTGGLSKLVSRYEIHRNAPSQSRNPQYTVNNGTEATLSNTNAVASPDVARKNGVEIRSDDIRQATSMKLKDRNPKLPTPSFVSDTPGRPIVSFDANWKDPTQVEAQADKAATDVKPGVRETNFPSHVPINAPSSAPSSGNHAGPFQKIRKISPKNIFARRHQQQQLQQQQQQQTTPAVAVTPPTDFRSPPPVPPQQQQHQLQHQQQHQPRPQARNIFSRPPAAQVNPVTSVPTICVSEEPSPAAPVSQAPIPIPSIAVSEDPTPSAPASRPQPAPPNPTIVLPGDDDVAQAPSSAPSQRSNVPDILVPGHGRYARGPAVPPIPVILTPDDSGDNNTDFSPSPPVIITTPSVQSSSTSLARPLPAPGGRSGAGNHPAPRSHWSRAHGHHPALPSSSTGSVRGSRATACCHECRNPIEGRFISLAGLPGAASSGSNGSERFHPQCFRCYSCGTGLEALEISPEPEEFRNARLHRIALRARGEILEEAPGETMGEDGDDRLRFFCHLDWHELFAPRCKHCTTPIVGEHVVALGEHWHVGHFFCAECGEPFGPGATHIEKDGYAWCVSCQTRRTERRAPKCRACGKAVIGQYVQALAAEWHDDCFRCAVCSGGFVDGQIFPREGSGGLMQVVCTMCRQRELKA